MDRKKILLIDDEKNFTELIKIRLEATGKFEVMTEAKGMNTMVIVKSFEPDLILLDVLMPDMSGGDVAFQLKNDPTTKEIPLIFLTATVVEQELEQKGGVIGGHIFIAKSVTTAKLVEIIEKTLGKIFHD